MAFAFPFQDPDLPLEARVDDLVGRMTLAEKASQMLHEAPAIERLGIPAYNWWNEGLHGVARAGVATVFPQAIGLAAMWDAERLHEVAVAISDEARAKHHEFLRQGDHGMYKGLTFWSPNINIFRDPRWGRGHETYGECPYLTARLGVAFCRGLQGDDPTLPEGGRDAEALRRPQRPRGAAPQLRRRRQREGPARDVPARVRGLHRRGEGREHHGARTTGPTASRARAARRCSGKILRGEWGFGGYVVSDCWAIKDFHEAHKVTKSWEESAAMAVKAGCDLNCGCTYEHIPFGGRAGAARRGGHRRLRQAAVPGAPEAGDVRSAGARAVGGDPVREERLRRAPRAGPDGGARVDRAAEERGRAAAAARRTSGRSR